MMTSDRETRDVDATIALLAPCGGGIQDKDRLRGSGRQAIGEDWEWFVRACPGRATGSGRRFRLPRPCPFHLRHRTV